MRAILTVTVILVAMAGPLAAQAARNPKELGVVRWHRDLEAGLAAAKAAKKPVFLQFQEVPG